MNQLAVKEMREVMGEVIAIEPKTGIPANGEVFKVCVKINLSTTLRRGVLAVTATGSTRWIRYYYEKQPHKICKECFILNHSQDKCKDMAERLVEIHDEPVRFGMLKRGGMKTAERRRNIIHVSSSHEMKMVKHTPFIPPKDGVMVATLKMNKNLEDEGEIGKDLTESARLGKGQRSSSVPLTITNKDDQISSNHTQAHTEGSTTMTKCTNENEQVFAVKEQISATNGESQITTDDLLQAIQIEERGTLDRKHIILEMWKQLALNEVVMALASVNFPDLKNVEFVLL